MCPPTRPAVWPVWRHEYVACLGFWRQIWEAGKEGGAVGRRRQLPHSQRPAHQAPLAGQPPSTDRRRPTIIAALKKGQRTDHTGAGWGGRRYSLAIPVPPRVSLLRLRPIAIPRTLHRLLVDLAQAGVALLRVPLGGARIGVAQNALDGGQGRRTDRPGTGWGGRRVNTGFPLLNQRPTTASGQPLAGYRCDTQGRTTHGSLANRVGRSTGRTRPSLAQSPSNHRQQPLPSPRCSTQGRTTHGSPTNRAGRSFRCHQQRRSQCQG